MMVGDWISPRRIEAHRLLRLEAPLGVVPIATAQRAMLPARTVEDVFYRGLIADVLDAAADAINTRLDIVINELPIIGAVTDHDPGRWRQLATVANTRRPVRAPFTGMKLQTARELLPPKRDFISFGRFGMKIGPVATTATKHSI